jgi:D-Ala-D-Ala carboxypeptidase 3 (S13) family/Thiamine pyrophosphate enzyme, central domain
MWFRLLALALLLLPAPALADVKEKVATLAPSGLVLVVDGKGNELVAQNVDEPFVPASVTKIVTAWLALEVLGGNYRFETRFYLDDKRVLYVRAGSLDRLAEYLAAVSPGKLAIIAGDEISTSNAAAETVLLADSLGAPVYGSSWPAHIPFPTAHPLWMGNLPTKATEISQKSAMAQRCTLRRRCGQRLTNAFR